MLDLYWVVLLVLLGLLSVGVMAPYWRLLYAGFVEWRRRRSSDEGPE